MPESLPATIPESSTAGPLAEVIHLPTRARIGQAALTEVPKPDNGAIFEHIPTELGQQVEARIEAKNQDRNHQQEGIGLLRQELSTGLMSEWVDDGLMKSRSLVENEPAFTEALETAVAAYQETAAGQQDARIKQLRDFLGNTVPSKEELVAMGAKVGTGVSRRKLKIVPKHASKVEQNLRYQAEQELNSLVPLDRSWDDEPQDWKTTQAKEGTVTGSLLLDTIQREASAEYRDGFKRFQEIYQGAHSTRWAPETGLDKLRQDVETVDGVHSEGATKLVGDVTASEELLSLMARGSLTTEEVIARLKDRELQDKVNLRGMFEEHVGVEWRKSVGRLPEPSLVGMRVGAEDVRLETGCLTDIASLAELCGVRTPDPLDRAKQQIEQDVKRTQALFHARIETPNSLYWHFTRQGMQIITTGELRSDGGEGGRNTGDFSKGIHFVKPGYGIETDIQYHSYARGTRTNNGQAIPNALGMVVIHRLGDIMERTPIRDEPLTDTYKGQGNVSEDVTFRASDGGSDYEYSLDDAYLLPLADWNQLVQLRDQGEFSDLFEPAGKPITRIAYDIAVRSLQKAGRSDEWIAAHVLPSETLVDPEILSEYAAHKGNEAALFNGVLRAIQTNTGEDGRVVVPLSAKRGSVESHDAISGVAPELWQEELVVIDVAA